MHTQTCKKYTHISKGKTNICKEKKEEKGKIELITKKTQKIYICINIKSSTSRHINQLSIAACKSVKT
jgi:hypothetical protein